MSGFSAMIEDLVIFLRAQLDEDERVARGTGGCRVAWLTYRREDGRMDYTTVAAQAADVWVAAGRELDQPASTLVFYDSARVLAEVDAKRKVIEFYEYAVAAWALDRDKPNPPTVHLGEKAMAEAVLQALALPYADRPGWREEWRL